jgi:uncharacterized protein YbcI
VCLPPGPNVLLPRPRDRRCAPKQVLEGEHDGSGRMPDAGETADQAHLNRSLANAVVRCYRRLAGRGPTNAQAFRRGDLVVVLLGGVLTVVERTLVAGGRQEAVRKHRSAIHDTMETELASVIQRLTGCRVEAALSADDVDSDLAAELFLLKPSTSIQA